MTLFNPPVQKTISDGAGTGTMSTYDITDPAVNAAVSTAIVDANSGVNVLLTGAPNGQTIQDPTNVGVTKQFMVVNDRTSTDNLVVTIPYGDITIEPGHGQNFVWNGTEWNLASSIDAEDVTHIPSVMLTSVNVQGALDQVSNFLGLLAPTPPVDLSGLTLTVTGVYTALEETTGTSRSTVTDDTTPTAYVNNFYDGDTGTLTAEVDSSTTGTRILSTADDSGTYGDLVITNDEDPYAGVPGQAGFYKQLDANVTPAAPLSLASHTLQLKHTVTGDSALYTVYIDDPGVTTISGVSHTLPGSNTRYVSGVPSLDVAENITIDFTLNNAVSEFYNATRVAALTSSQTTTQNLNPASVPAKGATIAFTGETCPIIASAYSEDVTIAITGYNSKNVAGTPSNESTNARVDTVSDESTRLVSGSGQYPAAGYGGAYNSSTDLKATYTEELQLLNGKYQRPGGNYTANLPDAGPDYSSGMGAGDRWVTFQPTTLTNASSFQLNILNSEGTWSGIETTGIKIYAKVQGATDWIDCNAAYPLSGSPSSDGDPAMIFASSSATAKVVTFGSTTRSGDLYIRIGLPDASNKKFSGISITNIT